MRSSLEPLQASRQLVPGFAGVRDRGGRRNPHHDGKETAVSEPTGGIQPAGEGLSDEEMIETVAGQDRKSTRLNSSHANISYAVFCLKQKKTPPRPEGTIQ